MQNFELNGEDRSPWTLIGTTCVQVKADYWPPAHDRGPPTVGSQLVRVAKYHQTVHSQSVHPREIGDIFLSLHVTREPQTEYVVVLYFSKEDIQAGNLPQQVEGLSDSDQADHARNRAAVVTGLLGDSPLDDKLDGTAREANRTLPLQRKVVSHKQEILRSGHTLSNVETPTQQFKVIHRLRVDRIECPREVEVENPFVSQSCELQELGGEIHVLQPSLFNDHFKVSR